MRIEIYGNSVSGLSAELNSLEKSISTSISKLKSTKVSIGALQNGASNNTNTASSSISLGITQKNQALTNVRNFKNSVNAFVEDTIITDKSVADLIKVSNASLKNELKGSTSGGNGILDSIINFLKDAWDGIKDTIASAWEKIQSFLADALEWLQENWRTIVKAIEVIIAVVGIVAAFCVSWIAGVTILAGALLIAIIDMTVGGTIWEHILKIGLGIAFVIGAIMLSVEAVVTILVGVAIAVVTGSAIGAFNAWMDGQDILSGAITGGEDALVLAGISTFVSSLLTRLNSIKVTPKTYDQSYLDNLENTENFDHNSKALDEIFKGQTRYDGSGKGYHYNQIEDTPGRIIDGTKTEPNEFGSYKAKVEVGGSPKTIHDGYSTFFSEDRSPQEIVNMINEAYGNRTHVPGTRNTYTGITNDGMEITMYLNRDGKIIDAFPSEW